MEAPLKELIACYPTLDTRFDVCHKKLTIIVLIGIIIMAYWKDHFKLIYTKTILLLNLMIQSDPKTKKFYMEMGYTEQQFNRAY